jgi:hypothetical protein
MTANQIVAMIFPLLAAAAVILTGLFAKKHWADRLEAEQPDADGKTVKLSPTDEKLLGLLRQAHGILTQPQRDQTPSARPPNAGGLKGNQARS